MTSPTRIVQALACALGSVLGAACPRGDSAPHDAGVCEERGEMDCASAPDRCNPLYAEWLEGEGQFMQGYVGCSSEIECNDLVTCAEDPQGDARRFPNSCVPAGWRTIGFSRCSKIR